MPRSFSIMQAAGGNCGEVTVGLGLYSRMQGKTGS